MLIPSISVRAATTKTMTIDFEEQLNGINRNKTVTIPNLKSITRITTNTGNVNHSINGEKVTINVSNGAISKQIWNDKKELKNVSNYLTSTINSFAETNFYSDTQGFSGTLSKNGSSKVVSGSPAGKTTYYPGTLSGTYEHSCTLGRRDSSGGWPVLSESFSYTLNGAKKVFWDTGPSERRGFVFEGVPYEGGIGTVNISSFTETKTGSSPPVGNNGGTEKWWGTVRFSVSSVVVDKPDTRVWQQDYTGVAYKSGYDNYYKYTVTIEYIDNSEPTLALTEPSENLYFGKEFGHNSIHLQGTVKDIDVGDKNTIKYTLNNGIDLPSHTNKIIVTNIVANGSERSFSYSIPVDDTIPEGSYQINIWAEDDKGGKSAIIARNLIVDKTGPNTTIVNSEAVSTSSIKLQVNSNDPAIYNTNKAGAGLHGTETYIFNKDGFDIDNGRTSNILIDTGLEPNRQYSYKVKAKDKLKNIGIYSNVSKLYTLALNPIKVILNEVTDTTLKFEVVNNGNNDNVPETIIELREKGKTTVASSSGWSVNSIKSLSGLTPGKEYEVYINTRNSDNKDNGWVTVPGDIPLEDESGNPVDIIKTLTHVTNFRISGSSNNTITVVWDTVEGQEYQVILRDEFNKEIDDSRSLWIRENNYTFTGLPLPNTKYVPFVSTRRENNSFMLNPVKVINEEKTYTDAESISKSTFTSGEDTIEIKLIVEASNNPDDTEYEIRNDTTTQLATVSHSSPVWINTDLAKESYYTYSVRVKNKNGKSTNFAKLVFINGEEAHTYIPDLEINDDVMDKPNNEAINLDELETWDSSNPVWFNPEELNGKTVILNGEMFIATQNRAENVKNKETIAVNYYTFSDSGYGYGDWKELNEGLFEEKIIFNSPGYYKTHTKFKNYSKESNPVIVNYLADWVKPSIHAESKIKNQTVVTGDSFEIYINAEDNMAKYLFYSVDGGKNYYLLKNNNGFATFKEIKKSAEGVQNKLTVKVCDVNGNVVDKVFTIFGVEK